jgi:hypothetical protein
MLSIILWASNHHTMIREGWTFVYQSRSVHNMSYNHTRNVTIKKLLLCKVLGKKLDGMRYLLFLL